MSSADLRARIFVSCGQSDSSNERQIAAEISGRLRELGFDPYVAVQEQSLRGIKENIFAQLTSSEYFLFIDFKRERLEQGSDCRGSLFSHQELAIASYLDIPVLAFQEDGVRARDGMLGFLQGNCVPFSDRRMLAGAVADAVQRRGWSAHWKNCLILERDEREFEDVIDATNGAQARYFHVSVRNANPWKAARNCSAYLQRIENLDRQTVPVKQTELKWAGFTFPTAVVGAGATRDFDAFWVYHQYPGHLKVPVFTDTTHYAPRITAPGSYEFTYCVVSDTFPTVRSIFLVTLGLALNDIRFVRSTRAAGT